MTHIQMSDQPAFRLGLGEHTCNWGAHMCGLYETAEERDAIIMGFLHEGDIAGDYLLYCPCERSAENFKAEYARRFPEDASHPDDPDRFVLLDPSTMYYNESGRFDPWGMEDRLNQFYAQTQKEQHRKIRGTAEMVWALEDDNTVEHLLVYESRLNYFHPGKSFASICLYNVNKFSGSVLMAVLHTHPYVVSGGVITENPFYQPPDEWLKKKAPDFLSRH